MKKDMINSKNFVIIATKYWFSYLFFYGFILVNITVFVVTIIAFMHGYIPSGTYSPLFIFGIVGYLFHYKEILGVMAWGVDVRLPIIFADSDFIYYISPYDIKIRINDIKYLKITGKKTRNLEFHTLDKFVSMPLKLVKEDVILIIKNLEKIKIFELRNY